MERVTPEDTNRLYFGISTNWLVPNFTMYIKKDWDCLVELRFFTIC